MRKRIYVILLLLTTLALFVSCDGDGEKPNETESFTQCESADSTEVETESETSEKESTVDVTSTQSEEMTETETQTETQTETETEIQGESETEETLSETESETAEKETVTEDKATEAEKDDETTENADEDNLYKDITCVSHTKYEKKQFYFSKEGYAINVAMPVEWLFSKNSVNKFDVIRNGNVIGSAQLSDGADKDWKTVGKIISKSGTVEHTAYIEKKGTGDTLCFRYRVTFARISDPEDIIFSVCIDYAEVSARTKNQFKSVALITDLHTDPQLGVAKSKRAQESILIIGNSFIGTSSVGSILREMCAQNSKSTEVNAISRGYAHVSTYTSDEYFMSEVKSGAYGIIFVCGLYSVTESEHLTILEEACKSSGTKLVIFPAHNEPRGYVDQAAREHSDLLLLDWKGEIDTLIQYGVDKWDMCINDAHLHSTPLAGYVGAQMIYRAVFGELPKKGNYSAISSSVLYNKLGDYCKNGTVSYVDDGAIVFK